MNTYNAGSFEEVGMNVARVINTDVARSGEGWPISGDDLAIWKAFQK
jgi:hypothetical protein